MGLFPFIKKYNCKGLACNDKGTIWVFWKEEVTLSSISSSDQHIQMKLPFALAQDIMISFVYASCDGRERRQLWNQLESTNFNLPWIMACDFNIVADQEEKVRRCPMNIQDMAEFL